MGRGVEEGEVGVRVHVYEAGAEGVLDVVGLIVYEFDGGFVGESQGGGEGCGVGDAGDEAGADDDAGGVTGRGAGAVDYCGVVEDDVAFL